MLKAIPQIFLALCAFTAALGALPQGAAGQSALSPARTDLGIREAERIAELEPVIADEVAHAATWMARGSAILGASLSAVERADDVVPVLAQGTDNRSRAFLLLPKDGEIAERQAERLEELMRDTKSGRTHDVSPGLVSILADVARAFPGQGIELVSGYRTPPNGAPNSKHFDGHAVDIRIPGVAAEKLRDYLWTEHRSIGLGYYPRQGFVHIDYRPSEPDIAWTAVQGGSRYRYHPPWARALRDEREPQSRVGL